MTARQRKILFNVSLFIVVLFSNFYVYVSFDANVNLFGISFVVLKMALFYINYTWLHPLLLAKKRYVWWVLSALLLIFIATMVRYGLEEVLFLKWWGYRNYSDDTTMQFYLVDNFRGFRGFIILSSLIRFAEQWYQLQKQKGELEKQRYAAELSFLKSQINPHFLFNTLNSIYSLSYQHSDKAPAAILKLSGIMRYMLYDTEDKYVPLEKEIQYLQNFVELQKMRFKENIYADLLVEGQVTSQQIVPLLLIAFVENAFKHGALTDPADPVLIQVNVEAGTVQLYVQNRINQQQKDQTGGIGIANIRRRLELLYPGRHELKIDNNGTHYICELTLQLT